MPFGWCVAFFFSDLGATSDVLWQQGVGGLMSLRSFSFSLFHSSEFPLRARRTQKNQQKERKETLKLSDGDHHLPITRPLFTRSSHTARVPGHTHTHTLSLSLSLSSTDLNFVTPLPLITKTSITHIEAHHTLSHPTNIYSYPHHKSAFSFSPHLGRNHRI